MEMAANLTHQTVDGEPPRCKNTTFRDSKYKDTLLVSRFAIIGM